MNDLEQRCAHPECHCLVHAGEAYCSEHCRKRVETPLADDPVECRCGHPACILGGAKHPKR